MCHYDLEECLHGAFKQVSVDDQCDIPAIPGIPDFDFCIGAESVPIDRDIVLLYFGFRSMFPIVAL
jgi:hypothetical protein